MTELAAQFFTQLADMAFDHILFDIFVKNSIDGIEDLSLADASAPVIDQIFKDPALTPRQWQRNSLELGISAIKKDAQLANLGGVALALVPAPDGTHPGQYFTNMDRFANNVIDAYRK
jgi:hypothetical protein